MKGLLPLFFLCLTTLQGQSLLEGDFWLDLDMLGYSYFFEDNWKIPRNQISEDRDSQVSKMLLEDIRYIFSAMLYGWEVRYRPADPALEVEEFYEIRLKREIPWGASQLVVGNSWIEDQRFFLHAYYRLDEREQSRRNSVMSNRYQDGGGFGSGSPFGEMPRRAALEQAVKQSLRNHFQPRVRRRPREISGAVYLRKMPQYSNGPDSYTCQILVKMDLDPLVEYPLNQ